MELREDPTLIINRIIRPRIRWNMLGHWKSEMVDRSHPKSNNILLIMKIVIRKRQLNSRKC